MKRTSSGWSLSPHTFVVLLLLAAMILAVGVLFLVNPDERPQGPPPEVTFMENKTMNQVAVNTTEPGLMWDDFQIQMDEPGGFTVVKAGAPQRVDPLVFTQIEQVNPVEKQDALEFCTESKGTPVTVSIRHTASGASINSWTFADMQSCQVLEDGWEGNESGDPAMVPWTRGIPGAIRQGPWLVP